MIFSLAELDFEDILNYVLLFYSRFSDYSLPISITLLNLANCYKVKIEGFNQLIDSFFRF